MRKAIPTRMPSRQASSRKITIPTAANRAERGPGGVVLRKAQDVLLAGSRWPKDRESQRTRAGLRGWVAASPARAKPGPLEAPAEELQSAASPARQAPEIRPDNLSDEA